MDWTPTEYLSGHIQVFDLPDDLKPNPTKFRKLWELHPIEKGKIKLYGKEMESPRWFQTFMKNYTFSKMSHPATELPELFRPYLDYANALCDHVYECDPMNGVLVNWYQDGSQYIAAHSDTLTDMVPGLPIICVSLGQERIFRIRTKSDKKKVLDLTTRNGSAIVMSYDMQKEYTHEITKQSANKIKGERISITFRRFK